MSNKKQTLDQRRATSAWEAIEAFRHTDRRADIVRAAKKLPIRIMTAGLGHALLFVKAKDKAPDLLTFLSAWVLRPQPATTAESSVFNKAAPTPRVSTAGSPDLLASVRTGSSDALRRHTAEAMAWLGWFNRFAEAEFPKDTTDEGEKP